jgi:hypothetical protein
VIAVEPAAEQQPEVRARVPAPATRFHWQEVQSLEEVFLALE